MKNILLICTFIFIPVVSHAQLKMNVTEAIISRLDPEEYNKKEMMIGKGFSTVFIYREHDLNIPYLELTINLKNIGNSPIVITPDSSKLHILYSFKGQEIKKRINFYSPEKKILLEPGKETTIFSSDYLLNNMQSVKLKGLKNYKEEVLERIMPTLEIEYEDINGIVARYQNIQKIKIQNHPTCLEKEFSEMDRKF